MSEQVNKAQQLIDWPYLWALARSHRRSLIVANIVAVFATLVSIPLPLLMPLLVDEVLLEMPGPSVAIINAAFPNAWHGPVLYISVVLCVTLLLRLIALVLGVLQGREFTRVAKDITYQMRKGLLLHLQRISMAEYETLGSGGVASHFVTDIKTIDDFIGSTVSHLLVSVLTIIGAAVILLWMHWQLALLILFVNPVVVYFTLILGKRVKDLKKKENSALEVFQQSLTETLDAIHQIRAANREQHYLGYVITQARKVKEHALASSWKTDAANRASFVVFLFGFDIFRAVAMLMVVFSDLTLGQMFAVFGYLWFMMGPVQEVLNIQYAWFGAKAALTRINTLLSLEEETNYVGSENPFKSKLTLALEFKDIHFAYKQDTPVLNGVNLRVEAGQKVALVGASGGGKSTLVQVLLGLYPAQRGEIFFDGVPMKNIGLNLVRENVATVLQHPALFNDTVRHNLTLGRSFADAALWRALQIAQLDQVIVETSQQLDAQVGRQGLRLSGGQRQRLAIARMLLMEPKIVILDEATSALDTETEQLLHQALDEFLVGKTTLIIAHRLSAVKRADHVYVFEDGHIIEEGCHAQLMAQNGLYTKLYGEYQ